jgi:hypothetical protein
MEMELLCVGSVIALLYSTYIVVCVEKGTD